MSNCWRIWTLAPATFNSPAPVQFKQDAAPSASDLVTRLGLTGQSNETMTQVTDRFYVFSLVDANGVPVVCAVVRTDVFEPVNTPIHSAVVTQ